MSGGNVHVDHNPETRPAAFDTMLLSKRKLMFFFAKRYHKDPDKQDELVNDTVVRALSRWQNFREDGSFGNWLKHLMWQIVTAERLKGKIDDSISLEEAVGRGLPATQEHCADARKVLGRAVHSDLLMRLAVGDTLSEIAEEQGVSRQAVGQMADRHRAKFLRKMYDGRRVA